MGKMSISAALAVGNIVKTKIEEESHKHQHPEVHAEGDDASVEGASLDGAVGGDDVKELEEEQEEQTNATPGDASKGDESTPSR